MLGTDALKNLGILLGLVWPGLLSVQMYRQLVPSEALDWGKAALQGFFYTVLNYILLFPFVIYLLGAGLLETFSFWSWLTVIFVFLIGPLIWPIAWVLALRKTRLVEVFGAPDPTPWDHFFREAKPLFVVATCKNGRRIGGYWGKGSFASAFPNHGDIYMSVAWEVTLEGRFGKRVEMSKGILLRKDEYHYLEFFEVPQSQAENQHGRQEGLIESKERGNPDERGVHPNAEGRVRTAGEHKRGPLDSAYRWVRGLLGNRN